MLVFGGVKILGWEICWKPWSASVKLNSTSASSSFLLLLLSLLSDRQSCDSKCRRMVCFPGTFWERFWMPDKNKTHRKCIIRFTCFAQVKSQIQNKILVWWRACQIEFRTLLRQNRTFWPWMKHQTCHCHSSTKSTWQFAAETADG